MTPNQLHVLTDIHTGAYTLTPAKYYASTLLQDLELLEEEELITDHTGGWHTTRKGGFYVYSACNIEIHERIAYQAFLQVQGDDS